MYFSPPGRAGPGRAGLPGAPQAAARTPSRSNAAQRRPAERTGPAATRKQRGRCSAPGRPAPGRRAPSALPGGTGGASAALRPLTSHQAPPAHRAWAVAAVSRPRLRPHLRTTTAASGSSRPARPPCPVRWRRRRAEEGAAERRLAEPTGGGKGGGRCGGVVLERGVPQPPGTLWSRGATFGRRWWWWWWRRRAAAGSSASPPPPPVSLGNLQLKATASHSAMYPGNKRKKLWREEKERLLKMTLEERRKEYSREYVALKDIPTWMEEMKSKNESDGENAKEDQQGKKSLSEKVSLYRGDITLLEVDAIVNAGRVRVMKTAGPSSRTWHFPSSPSAPEN
uniref:MACD2 deacetylase n=1 Tax=Anser brachyrhynchus TaxID=132585 RepID=A0A8B9BEV3_9AVES